MEININSRSEDDAPKQVAECESCKNLCHEAKEQVKVQDKKIYKMTIALAVAFTLLGQEAADKAVSLFDSVTNITDKAEGVSEKAESDNESEKEESPKPENPNSINISIPTNAFKPSSANTPRTPNEPSGIWQTTLSSLPPPSTMDPFSGASYTGFKPKPEPSGSLYPVNQETASFSFPLVPRSDALPPVREFHFASPEALQKDTNVCFDILPPPSTLTTLVAGLWYSKRIR